MVQGAYSRLPAPAHSVTATQGQHIGGSSAALAATPGASITKRVCAPMIMQTLASAVYLCYACGTS
jgi:hypothetical protein